MRINTIKALLSIVCVTACAKSVQVETRSPLSKTDPIRTIAVLQFNNFTEAAEAGRILPSLVGQEWRRLVDPVKVVDLEAAERLLSEKHAEMPAEVDRAKACEIGSILGADAVLVGSVFEYGTVRRPRRRAVVNEPVAAFEIQLVRVRDGLLLWSGFQARASDSIVIPSRQTPQDVALQGVQALAQGYATQAQGKTP